MSRVGMHVCTVHLIPPWGFVLRTCSQSHRPPARQSRAVLSAEVVTRRWLSGEKAHLRRYRPWALNECTGVSSWGCGL